MPGRATLTPSGTEDDREDEWHRMTLTRSLLYFLLFVCYLFNSITEPPSPSVFVFLKLLSLKILDYVSNLK